ncbi:MAG: DNA-directed RNA polymerase subunit beta, partial [Clostridiales bacterium]|nr:DNA-directed RNA polymerase subunit beta [Clostridiales bacterium]
MVNVKDVQLGTTTRKSFAKINEVMKMPNLIEVQKKSYQWFLDEGLKEVFRDIGSITDNSEKLILDFIDYSMDDDPKYSISECKARDVTYSKALKLQARLRNTETGEVKESTIYCGDLPLMTDAGTFVINGAERCIVSQLVRSPGVYYAMDHDKTGKELYTNTVIPNRGAWLEYETDANDIFYVRIDKNRKIYITTFLRSLGLGTDDEIREYFGDDEMLEATIEKDLTKNVEEALLEVYKKLRPGEPPTVDTAKAHLEGLFFDPRRYDLSRVGRYKYNKKLGMVERLTGQILAQPVISPLGEILADAGEKITKQKAQEIEDAGVMSAYVELESGKVIKIIGNGMVDIDKYVDGIDKKELAINEKVSYRVLSDILERVGDDKDALVAELKIHHDDLIPNHIIVDDIFATVSYLLNLANGVGSTDDIDHLGNRRVRCVGELAENQFRAGLVRVERAVKERLNQAESDGLTPQDLINSKPISAAIREFFGSSQLSQFMDQTNPLSEITHKRRISALGPGGLTRERAGFEVRDVHHVAHRARQGVRHAADHLHLRGVLRHQLLVRQTEVLAVAAACKRAV